MLAPSGFGRYERSADEGTFSAGSVEPGTSELGGPDPAGPATPDELLPPRYVDKRTSLDGSLGDGLEVGDVTSAPTRGSRPGADRADVTSRASYGSHRRFTETEADAAAETGSPHPEDPGLIEANYRSPGRSAVEHGLLVIAVVIVCTVVAAGAALVKAPTYSATSTLYVGKTLSLTQESAVAGLASAATTIAEDYARLINSSTVTAAVKKELGHPRSGLPGTLSASVVVQTPEIEVTASASSQAAAVRLANAGAAGLVAGTDTINATANKTLTSLRQQYVSLESQINSDTLEQQQLQSQLDAATGAGKSLSQTASLRKQIAALQTTVSQDTLDASTIQSQYSTSYSPLTQEEEVLKIISTADAATSNRKKTLEYFAVAGLFGGFLVGVALASAIDLRRDRKRRRRAELLVSPSAG